MDISGITQPGFLRFIYIIFSETAPFIILGLLLVGWMKILIPVAKIHTYLGQQNLRSALYAALFGLPLPLCSCSILPVALGLREKKASRESLLSFIISSPETSIDTVILSWGLLGPFMALIRPVTAFISALFSAALSIGERTDRSIHEEENFSRFKNGDYLGTDTFDDSAYHVVGVSGFWSSLKNGIGRILRAIPGMRKVLKKNRQVTESPVAFRVLVKDSLHYGFTYMLDTFSLWFVIGIITSALIGAFVPAGWFKNIPGGQITEIFFMLLISIPMYVCSFESTPIAAMLILKGLSPGAALVFLLAGPATNISTIILLLKFFGKKFMSLYLAGISIISVGAGLGLNALLKTVDISVSRDFIMGSASPFRHWLSIVSAVILLGLLILSFSRLDWRALGRKWLRVFNSIGFLIKKDSNKPGSATYRLNWKNIVSRVLPVVLIIYLATGIYQVGPGNEGFRFTLGRMTQSTVQPGIHYRLPPPFERVEIHPVNEMKSVEIGYTLTDDILRQWREHSLAGASMEWHSFFTNIQTNTEQSLYLLGDENQIEAKFSLHYLVQDPVDYYYCVEEAEMVISLAFESILRKALAVKKIDDVLTVDRSTMVPSIVTAVQDLLDRWSSGVMVVDIFIVDLHPPVETVDAFRDVASAREDRQTAIHYAYSSRAAAIPEAKGRATQIIEDARSYALEKTTEAEHKTGVYQLLLHNFNLYPGGNRTRMYLEALETALPGKRKIIVPADVSGRGDVRVWSGFPGNMTAIMENE